MQGPGPRLGQRLQELPYICNWSNDVLILLGLHVLSKCATLQQLCVRMDREKVDGWGVLRWMHGMATKRRQFLQDNSFEIAIYVLAHAAWQASSVHSRLEIHRRRSL